MKYYRYDGSYEGFLCCVFESYLKKECPDGIFPEDEEQMPLVPPKWVETEPEKAKRVEDKLKTKAGTANEKLLRLAFLSQLPEKELFLLRLIRRLLKQGKSLFSDLADEEVLEFYNAIRNLKNEAHLFKGFLRFSESGEGLWAQIEPKNQVLPLVGGHFSKRLAGERFVIYDQTHKQMLLCAKGDMMLLRDIKFTPPAPGKKEEDFRKMWRVFYHTTAISERKNERCRMTHMPKRYWKNMIEMTDEVR